MKAWVLQPLSRSILHLPRGAHLKWAERAANAARSRRGRGRGGARARVGTLAAAALGRRPSVAALRAPALAEPGIGGGAWRPGTAGTACRRQPTCCRKLLDIIAALRLCEHLLSCRDFPLFPVLCLCQVHYWLWVQRLGRETGSSRKTGNMPAPCSYPFTWRTCLSLLPWPLCSHWDPGHMPVAVTVALMPELCTAADSSMNALSSGCGSTRAASAAAALRAPVLSIPSLLRMGFASATTPSSSSCNALEILKLNVIEGILLSTDVHKEAQKAMHLPLNALHHSR